MEEQTKITIESPYYGGKLELSFSKDADIDEWHRIFRVILKWIEFTDETVDELFNRNSFGEPLEDEINPLTK